MPTSTLNPLVAIAGRPAELEDAYLNEWVNVAPRAALEAALGAARQLEPLHRAANYARIVAGMPQWERSGAVAFNLRRLAETLGR